MDIVAPPVTATCWGSAPLRTASTIGWSAAGSVTGVASVTAVMPKAPSSPADRGEVGYRPRHAVAEPPVEPVDPAGGGAGGVDLDPRRELAAVGDRRSPRAPPC